MMSNCTDEQWEQIAKAWREAAKQGDSIKLNVIEFVKWLKSEGYIKDYVVVPDGDLCGASGKFEGGVAFYGKSVWQAAKGDDPRAIWTVLHEACHGIHKHEGVRYRAHGVQRRVLSARTGRDEFEADRLTACILAPFEKADFKLGMTVDDVAVRFCLSREAAKIRLEEFARLYRRQNGTRRQLPPGIIDFLAEQKRKGFLVTSLSDEHRDMLPTLRPRFEGDPCPSCGEFALVRAGIGITCDQCGAQLGDD
jgi:hypothetical protein